MKIPERYIPDKDLFDRTQDYNFQTGNILLNRVLIPYITLSLVRKNDEEECDRRSGERVNV